MTIRVLDRSQVTHYLYGFVLINDEGSGIINMQTENDRKCDMEEWWKVAYWLYIALVINNFFFFIIGASLWHTIGITMSLQMIIYFPMLHNYPPSCLSKFFKDFQITIGKTPWLDIQNLVLGLTDDDRVPMGWTNYRLERQGFISFNMLYNSIEMLMLFAFFIALIIFVFIIRCLCCCQQQVSWYETRFRWELLIKGFILVYMHIMLCCFLNINTNPDNVSLDSTANSLSYVIVLVFIIAYIVILVFSIYLRSLPFSFRKLFFCRGMFRDLDVSTTRKIMFYCVYLLKRTLFAMIFAFGYDAGISTFNSIYVLVIFLPLLYL